MKYTCPVCGDDLDGPPENHNICERCDTQFGYTDCTRSHEELRREYLSRQAEVPPGD